MFHSRAVLAAFVLTLAISSATRAQCLAGDDGFDIGCCTPFVTPTIPNFAAFTMNASWGELSKCTPTNLNTVLVTLTAPATAFCDYKLLQIFVNFPGGETITGLLAAKYVRVMRMGPSAQVWRFLVNGDLSCTPLAASTPCTTPLPRCSFNGVGVHFDGHIDYHCDFISGVTTVSFSLSHHSGCISHAPWSCMPVGGILAHNESSYHLVGPAPFVFAAPSPIPVGGMVSDSARSSFLQTVPTLIYVCESEQKIGPIGNLTGAPSSCVPAACLLGPVCSTAACTAANTCYEDVGFQFSTCCAGSIWPPSMTQPIPGTPIQATGMLAIRLGTWGLLPQYPAGVSLRTYFGVMTYSPPNPCPPINSGIHAAVGVCTTGFIGQPYNLAPTCLPPPPLVPMFMDLQNCLPLNSAGPLSPGYGCLSASDVVWSFNIP